jgi:peptide/nickel transport system substrate-binding protein
MLAAAGAAALVLGIAAAAAPSALADSATPTPAATTAAEPSTLTIGMTTDIDSANPFTGIVAEAYEVFQMMYPTLTDYGASDFGTVPGMAESWQESADKKSWTYKIRAGMKWSDGQPMTAEDAAYTINRVKNGKYESINYGNYVQNIINAEATDDTTLVVHLKKPTPVMEHLGIYILPEHIWKDISETDVKKFKNEPTPGNPIVSGGPYVFVERQVGQFIRLEANPNYWRGEPAVSEVVFRVYGNDDAMAQALKKGEIDFADSLPPNVFKSLQGVDGITTVNASYPGFNEIAFNTGAALSDGTPIGDGSPLLKDEKLRQAMSWAIDRQALVDKVLGGLGSPGSTVIPPNFTNLHLDPANPMGYDPDKAKSLLDAAGYKVGDDGIRVAPDGTRLSFRLFGRSNSSTSKKSVEFVKGYLNAVGIEVTVSNLGDSPLIEKIGEGDYDMFEWGWVVDPDPDYQLSTATCGKRSYKDGGTVYADLSDSFFCDPQYDELYKQQATETDPAKRAEIVKQMQQIFYDSAAYIVTFYYTDPQAYRSDRFTGFVAQPDPDGVVLFQWGTWSYDNLKPVSAAAPVAEPGSTNAAQQTPASSSTNWGLIIGIIVAVLIVAGVGFGLARGRAGSADDRE